MILLAVLDAAAIGVLCRITYEKPLFGQATAPLIVVAIFAMWLILRDEYRDRVR